MGLLYLGNALFRQHFYDRVIYPCKNPQTFHPDHLPLQRTFAIYGQKGNHKLEVVKELLQQEGIKHVALTVAFAFTTEFFERFMEFRSEQYDMSKESTPLVVVINRADILVHEPDDKLVTRLTTKFEEIAKQMNWLIVCLFDRMRGEQNPYKEAFFAQFPYLTVLSSPATDKQFIMSFYKQKFDSFCSQYKLTNTIQEHEYQMLSDVSVYATVDDLAKFCQAIFFEMIKTEAAALSFTEHVEKRLKDTGGIVHIDTIMYQMAKMVDEQFTMMIGIMPKTSTVKKPQKRQRFEDEEYVAKVETKEEQEGPVKMELEPTEFL